MCEFELNTRRYRSCTLLKYGRAVEAHTIVTRYVHQCEDPKPEPGFKSICCDERLQTERVKVQDSADRGHTMVTGDCPACKAAEEKCLEVFPISNPNAPTRKPDTAQPTIPQLVVEQNPLQPVPVVEQNRAAEPVTNNTTDAKRKPHPRQPASAKGQQSVHGRSHDRDCKMQ